MREHNQCQCRAAHFADSLALHILRRRWQLRQAVSTLSSGGDFLRSRFGLKKRNNYLELGAKKAMNKWEVDAHYVASVAECGARQCSSRFAEPKPEKRNDSQSSSCLFSSGAARAEAQRKRRAYKCPRPRQCLAMMVIEARRALRQKEETGESGSQ